MGVFARLFGLEKKADIRDVTLEEFLRHGAGHGYATKSGPAVNAKRALQVSTVLAVSRRISEAITVPCKLYRRSEDGRRTEVRDHPLYKLIASKPNSAQSAYEFRETIGYHYSIFHNAYVLMLRVGGQIDELIPLVPEYVKVVADQAFGVSHYVYQPLGSGVQRIFQPDEIWHIRGPGWTTVEGMSALNMTKEAIALAIATEESHARFHANGARPSGLVSVNKTLTDTQLVRFAAFVQAQISGLSKVGNVLTMDNDAKFTSTQMKGVDSEHLATRAFQVEEICRGAGVLPIMVGHTDKAATYASAEQMFLAHLVHTVRPLHDRFASSMDRWLLTEEERNSGMYFAFKEEAFLSPAMKDKAEYRKTALGGSGSPGWLTPNEVRAHDELDPIEGGSHLYAPTNTGPIDANGVPTIPAKTTGKENVAPPV